jgi:hypothetical protein
MSVLRPRDIQARIRSGESPEAVAAAAQTTVEKIAGFANPALAERAHIAQQARQASVRRRTGDGPPRHLGEAVADRLQEDGVRAEDVGWDSWRRDDGRWTVVADYDEHGHHRRARFVYDTAGRYVVADDDESRRLIGERAGGRGPADGEQLGLGDDAIALVTGEKAPSGDDVAPVTAGSAIGSPHDPSAEPTVDLTPAAAAVRSPEPPADDWMATQATERPAPRPATAEPDALFSAELAAPPATAPPATAPPGASPEAGDAGPEGGQVPAPEEPGAADDAPARERPARPKRSGRGRGRASVPSWDEIMLGSGRSEE